MNSYELRYLYAQLQKGMRSKSNNIIYDIPLSKCICLPNTGAAELSPVRGWVELSERWHVFVFRSYERNKQLGLLIAVQRLEHFNSDPVFLYDTVTDMSSWFWIW